jgi:hypothetical protein
MVSILLVLIILGSSYITHKSKYFERVKSKYNLNWDHESDNLIKKYLVKVLNCTKCLSFQASFVVLFASQFEVSLVSILTIIIISAACSFFAQELD